MLPGEIRKAILAETRAKGIRITEKVLRLKRPEDDEDY